MVTGFGQGLEPLTARLRTALDVDLPPVNGRRVAELCVEFCVLPPGRINVFYFAFPACATRPEPLFCLNCADHDPERARSQVVFGIEREQMFKHTADYDWLRDYFGGCAKNAADRILKDGLPAPFMQGFREVSWTFRRLSLTTPPIIGNGSPWSTYLGPSEAPINDDPGVTIRVDLSGDELPPPCLDDD